MVEVLKQIAANKTMKRELAVAALLFWAIGTVRLVWVIDPTTISLYTDIYGPWTTMTWLFAGGAFGLDAFQKMGKGT